MTIVVAFLCLDGVVVAADSMLTASMGNYPIAHHTGRKLDLLNGNQQIFAYAGDLGQGARVRILAEGIYSGPPMESSHPLDYPLDVSESVIQQFRRTEIHGSINVSAILAYAHDATPQCCVFEAAMQPRLLDTHHFYCALGSGKLSADPFLRFLVDIFCLQAQPTVREAVFLATWTVEHVIRTNPGGVAGPIRICVLERVAENHRTRALSDPEIEEHREAIASAQIALRTWRTAIQSGAAAGNTPPPPEF